MKYLSFKKSLLNLTVMHLIPVLSLVFFHFLTDLVFLVQNAQLVGPEPMFAPPEHISYIRELHSVSKDSGCMSSICLVEKISNKE